MIDFGFVQNENGNKETIKKREFNRGREYLRPDRIADGNGDSGNGRVLEVLEGNPKDGGDFFGVQSEGQLLIRNLEENCRSVRHRWYEGNESNVK